MPLEAYTGYLDLRKYGSVPHSGEALPLGFFFLAAARFPAFSFPRHFLLCINQHGSCCLIMESARTAAASCACECLPAASREGREWWLSGTPPGSRGARPP